MGDTNINIIWNFQCSNIKLWTDWSTSPKSSNPNPGPSWKSTIEAQTKTHWTKIDKGYRNQGRFQSFYAKEDFYCSLSIEKNIFLTEKFSGEISETNKAWLFEWCTQKKLKPTYSFESKGKYPKVKYICTLAIDGIEYRAISEARNKKDAQVNTSGVRELISPSPSPPSPTHCTGRNHPFFRPFALGIFVIKWSLRKRLMEIIFLNVNQKLKKIQFFHQLPRFRTRKQEKLNHPRRLD